MRPLVIQLGEWLLVVLLAASVAWGAIWEHDRAIANDAVLATRLQQIDRAVQVLDTLKARSDTIFSASVEHYHNATDTVIRELVSVKGDSVSKVAAVQAATTVKKSCDAVVLSCQQRATIDDEIVDSLRAENGLLRHGKSVTEPRLSLYGEALYDPLRASPVLRAGASARLFGPVSLIGELEGSRAHGDTVTGRILVGGRFTFR